jgi:hypothetical protein
MSRTTEPVELGGIGQSDLRALRRPSNLTTRMARDHHQQPFPRRLQACDSVPPPVRLGPPVREDGQCSHIRIELYYQMLRFYSPTAPLFDGTWALPDVEPT